MSPNQLRRRRFLVFQPLLILAIVIAALWLYLGTSTGQVGGKYELICDRPITTGIYQIRNDPELAGQSSSREVKKLQVADRIAFADTSKMFDHWITIELVCPTGLRVRSFGSENEIDRKALYYWMFTNGSDTITIFVGTVTDRDSLRSLP